jgi:hypothetical protein
LTDDYFVEEAGAAGSKSDPARPDGVLPSGGTDAGGPMPAPPGGCAMFVLPELPDHHYALCTAVKLDFVHAEESCRALGMRLAWLESAAENTAVSAKVNAVGAGIEAWVGATDQELEGSWHWAGTGGEPFWLGGALGAPVEGAFAAWASGTPNNGDQNSMPGEDCAAFIAATATWGDRVCTTAYPYLCEQPE